MNHFKYILLTSLFLNAALTGLAIGALASVSGWKRDTIDCQDHLLEINAELEKTGNEALRASARAESCIEASRNIIDAIMHKVNE